MATRSRGAGAHPLRVAHHDGGCRPAARRRAAPSGRPAPARATPCPRPRCPRRSCRTRRRARGTRRRAAARARAPSSVSSSSRHGGAHRPCLGDLEGTLVGDLEVADLLDRVAPELEAQRVLLGGREHVEDAAAHRELAALLDEVGAQVRGVHQAAGDQRRARCPDPPHPHRLELAEPGHQRLEHRADRRDDHPERCRPASGWASRRSTASRRPTVSERGESRSCGSVSQAGNSATAPSPSSERSAAARSSASRPVAVTASTGRPAAAMAARAGARSPGTAVRSRRGTAPERAASVAAAIAGSRRSGSMSPDRVMGTFRGT